MFETGIHLWLQSADSQFAITVLSGISLLGYLPTYALLIVILAFGVRLRAGLAVLGAVLLTGLVTDTTKEIVALPRPDQVDSRLVRTTASGGQTIVSRGGAPGFWSLPTPEAIEKVRASGRGNYGFPSGHVSAATALLACTAWFVRSRWLYAFSAAWVLLMALSRMYLGRHFLADVLGGLIIGLGVSAIWMRLFPALDPGDRTRGDRRALYLLWILSLILVVLTPFLAPLPPRYVGALVGLAITHGVVLAGGAPEDEGTTRRRVSKVLLALILFATTLGATEWLLAFAGRSGDRLPELLSGAIVTASTFAGTVVLGRRFRRYDASSAD